MISKQSFNKPFHVISGGHYRNDGIFQLNENVLCHTYSLEKSEKGNILITKK
jgi:hypothetical protein